MAVEACLYLASLNQIGLFWFNYRGRKENRDKEKDYECMIKKQEM